MSIRADAPTGGDEVNTATEVVSGAPSPTPVSSDVSSVNTGGTPASAGEGTSAGAGGAGGNSSPSGPAVETGGEPATFPSHDEFGWDGWAGDADGLPEPVRPWGKAIGDYHRTAAENEWKGKLNDAHQMQRVYEELMTGNEDPRIGEFSGQLAERQKAFDELQEQFNTQKTEHAQYQEQVQAWYAAEADKWTKRFERQHPKLAADPKKVELLAELFSEGWEDDMAVELLSMEEASVSTARQAIKDGVPPEYAYRLAKAQSAPAKKPQPSPAAVAMSGADSTTRHTPLSKIEPLTGNTFEDTKFAAIRRNMNKKGKRR